MIIFPEGDVSTKAFIFSRERISCILGVYPRSPIPVSPNNAVSYHMGKGVCMMERQ